MWTFTPSPSILLNVKRIFIFMALLVLVMTFLPAERAFWLGDDYEGESAATDKYTEESTLIVSYGDKSVLVQVVAPLPDTLEGREIGLTRTALEELGIWGMGDTEVSVKLRKGSEVEPDNTTAVEDTGWYSLRLRSTKRTLALDNYKALTANSIKVRTEIEGDMITFTVPYVAEYEVEEKKALIESLGFTVEEVNATDNPYLR